MWAGLGLAPRLREGSALGTSGVTRACSSSRLSLEAAAAVPWGLQALEEVPELLSWGGGGLGAMPGLELRHRAK